MFLKHLKLQIKSQPHKVLIGISLFLIFFSLTVFSIGDKQIPAAFFGGKELSSPGDWISEDQINVYSNRIVINIKNATWAGFTDTNSMDPFIDASANAIEIIPRSPELIKIGDVISYKTNYGIIIHRIIEVGEDKEGTYYIVKGDNNRFEDPSKVRFKDIVGVVVAVIY